MSKVVYIERDGQFFELELKDESFSIDESELDRELCTMGKLIFEHGTYEAEAKMRVGRLDAEKERLGAVLDAKYRASFEKAGEKATEGRIKNAVIADASYQEVVQALVQAENDAATLKWAMSSLTHKSDCLRALAYRETQSIKADRSS